MHLLLFGGRMGVVGPGASPDAGERGVTRLGVTSWWPLASSGLTGCSEVGSAELSALQKQGYSAVRGKMYSL